ncbi:hypothetical protein E5D57_012502 [Metarhizium anisopliae]|nr:hypothetical protein E5D57_012502 [Metarhizium anisopliae]
MRRRRSTHSGSHPLGRQGGRAALPGPGASESCVTWAVCGVLKLQEVGILERFDTVGFADKVLEYAEARLALLNSDDPGIDADRFGINRYDSHQGKIIDESRDASLPCKRAGVPGVAVNTNAKNAESKGPTVEKTQDGELIAEASEKSKESFNRLLEEYNFSSVAKQDRLYTELSTRLPEFTAPRVDRIAGFTNKIAGGALAVAGLALYGKAVADVLSSDASVLDKAAVVTSILPGIGYPRLAPCYKTHPRASTVDKARNTPLPLY